LTIRGEKREEAESRRNGYEVVERRYGSFVRTLPLPPGLDLDRAEARVRRGVLTVKIPKTAAFSTMRRVPIET
jgi:HSP20 family protein